MRVPVLTNSRPNGKRHIKRLGFNKLSHIKHVTVPYGHEIDLYGGLFLATFRARKGVWPVPPMALGEWTRT